MIARFTSITPKTRSARYTHFPTNVVQIRQKIETVLWDIEHHSVRLLQFVSDNGMTVMSLNLGDLDFIGPDGEIKRTVAYESIKDGVFMAMRAHCEPIA